MTLTVAELKKELDKYPDDMPVYAQWEGVYACIDPDLMDTEHYKEVDCLIIDVESKTD